MFKVRFKGYNKDIIGKEKIYLTKKKMQFIVYLEKYSVMAKQEKSCDAKLRG